MVYREVYASNKGMYLAALSNMDTDKDIADITVYDTEKFTIINTLKKVPYGIGGTRCAISDDGKYLVGCSFHKRKGMVLYNVQTGKRLWTNKDYTKIQTLHFSKDNQCIIVGTEWGECYFISVEIGEEIKYIRGKEVFENNYGEDVIIERKEVAIGDTRIEAMASCLTAIATKTNIITSLVSDGLYAYDYAGTLLWENYPAGILHFLKLSYDEVNDIIYGIAPEAIIGFAANDGTVLGRVDFETIRSGFSSLFIRENKCVLGADKKIYDLDNGKITLSSERTSFDIGYTIESYVEDSKKKYGEEVQVEASEYNETMLQLVPKKLQKLYQEYKKIVVPYLQIYSIEEALELTEETGVKDKGYFIFGYGEDSGYLLCALDNNPIERFYISTKNIKDTINPEKSKDILTTLLVDLEWDYRYK